VQQVLKELGADEKPIITALNKIDLLDDQAWLEGVKRDFPHAVAISAKLKQNLDILTRELERNFHSQMISLQLLLPHARMDLVDLFYRQGKVEEIKYLQKGIKVKVNLPKVLAHNILQNKEIQKIS
jgi:GTP-binding protein HflX